MTHYRCTRKDPSALTVVLTIAALLGTAYLCWQIIPELLK